MAYDSINYDIKSRLPEWWKHDGFLEPINRYSQELIRDIIGGLLGNFGVVQPFQIWKTLPTEYSWTHMYGSGDPMLKRPEGGYSPLILQANKPVYAYIPNSKRNCHGIIQLRLEGDIQGFEKSLGKLTIKNANQTITFNDITTTTDIKIFTEDGTILIDGVQQNDLVTGRFDKIYPQAYNTNYDEVDIDDENKTTYISIESDTTVNFALNVKLIHPVYVTEQNMRIHTVSAFPIEWIKLYGFYCHEFNNKQEWRFLWEKHYKEDERVVFDRITKQFDCETFYMQVKLYGIGLPFVYGFPQEEFSNNAAFQTNKNLDKWGKIYGLHRRFYKTHITEDEEYYTYPQFYNYPIEQDYWYEERLVNEYRHNDDAINAAIVKDTELNDIAILRCIDPSINDIYVYTETIKSSVDNKRQTNEIYPTALSEDGEGVTWTTPHEASNGSTTATEINLQPQNSESFNEKLNQTKILEIQFDDIPELPKNINIKGIELQLNGLTDIHSISLILDNRSQLLLPTIYTKANGEVFKKIDNIQINNEIQYWEKGKGVYKIGGPTDLFNVPEIKREQIQDGMTFNIGFTNLNTFLKATIVLYSIQLIVYYEIVNDTYDIDVELDHTQIILDEDDRQEVNMKINLENTGSIPVVNKNIYIIGAKGIDITNTEFPTFDLDVGEKFVIGETNNDNITITPTQYPCLKLIKNAVITQEVDISTRDTIEFMYKMDRMSVIDVYINNEKIDSVKKNTTIWNKYVYRIKKCDRISNKEDESCKNADGTYRDTNRNWGHTVTLKLVINDTKGHVFIKNPEKWNTDNNSQTINEVKTGLYDVIVFCDDKSIKNTITVRQTK